MNKLGACNKRHCISAHSSARQAGQPSPAELGSFPLPDQRAGMGSSFPTSINKLWYRFFLIKRKKGKRKKTQGQQKWNLSHLEFGAGYYRSLKLVTHRGALHSGRDSHTKSIIFIPAWGPWHPSSLRTTPKRAESLFYYANSAFRNILPLFAKTGRTSECLRVTSIHRREWICSLDFSVALLLLRKMQA